MNDQTFLIACVTLCSLGGWYVVITKYLALKKMIRNPDDDFPVQMQHIPGMGPPPVSNLPFMLSDDMVQQDYMSPKATTNAPTSAAAQQQPAAQTTIPPTSTAEKRIICNEACVMHLLGFAIISGVPFLNIILPTIFWLWKKEQHPFLAKQGREVINFQITYTILQFLVLGAGVLFIRYAPSSAEKLFAFTKISRIVFTSAMHLPFNVFTMIPFFWCCIVMIRGAVAAYHGINYKYPATQQFLFTQSSKPTVTQKPATQPTTPQVEPTPRTPPPAPRMSGKVSFG